VHNRRNEYDKFIFGSKVKEEDKEKNEKID